MEQSATKQKMEQSATKQKLQNCTGAVGQETDRRQGKRLRKPPLRASNFFFRPQFLTLLSSAKPVPVQRKPASQRAEGGSGPLEQPRPSYRALCEKVSGVTGAHCGALVLVLATAAFHLPSLPWAGNTVGYARG